MIFIVNDGSYIINLFTLGTLAGSLAFTMNEQIH